MITRVQLTLLNAISIPFDLSGIAPARLHGLSEAQIAKVIIRVGNREEALGDVYRIAVATNTDAAQLVLEGDHSHAANIGRGMLDGTLTVHGPVGPHAGAQMTGGTLHINGDAGDSLGAEMRGGAITVTGHAGHNAGAAYPGSRRGMAGGTIAIHGTAGDELGHKMRRGIITTHGGAGAFAGAGMIAGTIVSHGPLGRHTGAGMIRGTILAGGACELAPGFVHACDYAPAFLGVLRHDGRLPTSFDSKSVRCHRGDVLTGGRGEAFTPVE